MVIPTIYISTQENFIFMEYTFHPCTRPKHLDLNPHCLAKPWLANILRHLPFKYLNLPTTLVLIPLFMYFHNTTWFAHKLPQHPDVDPHCFYIFPQDFHIMRLATLLGWILFRYFTFPTTLMLTIPQNFHLFCNCPIKQWAQVNPF